MRINPADQYGFPTTHSVAQVIELIEAGQGADGAAAPVAIDGRLLAIRDLGNMFFADLHDQTGRIQVVGNLERTPDYADLGRIGVGDWVGVQGTPARTRKGEPSVFVDEWSRLAATELGFPDKLRGLTDPDTIARQRYLDLATNPESMARFIARSNMVSWIRNILGEQGFLEVETPMLHTLYGGASARPFETHHNALDLDLYLRIAPELPLKRLVVGGLKRVFEIGKVFRNEGISTRHNPEFTMMEVYAANWSAEEQMELTENLVRELAIRLHGTDQIEYQGEMVDLSTPWRRATMDELVSNAVGKPISIDTNIRTLRALCKQHGVETKGAGPGKLLLELYEKLVERNLRGPIFVTDYPQEVSPLARAHRSRPGYTERFEGIVAGSELCNGYTELNNAREQYERFKDQERQSATDDEAMPMDHDYVRALQYGLPPTGGMGIGIDRLAAVLTNASSIRDVIFFPTMRPDGFKVPYE